MDPVVVTLASDERYFPGLYCVVASLLSYFDAARKLDLKVLDGGLSCASMDSLAALVGRFGETVRLEYVRADRSVFRNATPGPGQSHMAYSRILLPHLLDVQRVIYLDCDILVFRDVSELFDLKLPAGKVLAAVADSETLSLTQDSRTMVDILRLPPEAGYFNSGVMLMELDELKNQHFFERAVDFLNDWRADYRFHDQSAINFLLQGRIARLPEYWNRASWRFDKQQDNTLNCLLHYTTSTPWICGTHGPAQALFERFAASVGMAVNRKSFAFTRGSFRRFWQAGLAPLRAFVFPVISLLYRITGNQDRSSAYKKVAAYWLDYIHSAPSRRQLHRRRVQEISRMKFHIDFRVLTK